MEKSLAQYPETTYPVYKGSDLGMIYKKERTVFRIWSPVATAAELLLYREGQGGSSYRTVGLKKDQMGTWVCELTGDMKGLFYVFRVLTDGRWSQEVVDPYAKATGVNGQRAMVIDLTDTDPPGWAGDVSPSFSETNAPTDAVIYELHTRDASMHESSGILAKGKFVGLAETGTTWQGISTGLSHLMELGITHVHLLPFYDYNSVDESGSGTFGYNWGYDPLNYNVPEGSYSTNPADGITRIKELKQMISAFHRNGLRIVMDVVYNHTALTETSNFNQLVPGYYYRHKTDGSFSNATACGNETASERPMMQKFMLESLLYWVKEYHVDGFRFDLMGVHDIETMNIITAALHKVKPGILLYGEGWTAGDSPLPESLRAIKKNASKLEGIAVFNDDIRDGIKGSVFKLEERGFVNGNMASAESVRAGIIAACAHPQVDYTKVNYSSQPYAAAPANVISYSDCHDNNILWDKLKGTNPQSPAEDLKKMQRLALTIVLTSQGIPFLHAGSEFFRTKQGVENSYNSGDSINAIDWNLKKENIETVRYIQQLIRMRKTHPAFRMRSAKQLAANIDFNKTTPAGTIIYTIDGKAAGDQWKKIWVAFNGTEKTHELPLPPGTWKHAIELQPSRDEKDVMLLEKYSAAILYEAD